MPYAEVLNQRFGGQPLSKAMKSYGEANKTISEGGRPIGYPPPEATKAEVDKWRSANGLHEKFTAADYELMPAEPVEGWSDDLAGRFGERLLARNVPPALAKGLAEDYLAIEADLRRQAQDAYEASQFEAQKQLQQELGPEYRDRMQKIKAVVASQGFDPADKELFASPTTVRFLSKIVGLLGEDTVASMRQGGGGFQGSIGDPGFEANRIMTDPTHPDHKAYQNGEPAAAAKVERLLTQCIN